MTRVHTIAEQATIDPMGTKKKLKDEKRSVGRPRLNRDALTADLHIRLDPAELERLNKYVIKHKRTKTDVVREGLRLLGVLP